jgi:hypothetical protein
MARIIHPDGSSTPLGNDKTPLTLKQMQEAVGGYIEPISNPTNPEQTMIVNEEFSYAFESDQVNPVAIRTVAEWYQTTPDNIVQIRGNVIVAKDSGEDWF